MSQPAFDFDDGVPLEEPVDLTYSVSELADAINQQLRRGFHDGVWVRGEINGLVRRGPHVYFSLIDASVDGPARVDVKLFAPMLRRLTPVLKKSRLELADGLDVRLHGHLDYWAQGGSLGLKMDGIDPRYTLGTIAQSRDAIMRRLVASGLIDLNKRQSLSPIPLRVGVAASIDSAAWADFRVALESSGYGFDITFADTRVQGDGADRMIAGAIGTLARGADAGLLDLIVVIRGGGARNELAVFDSEIIAHTIARVPIPVFTGLGHEIDRSIADDVAHTSHATPTACATAIVDRVSRYAANVEMSWHGIVRRAEATLDAGSRRVDDVAQRIGAQTLAAVERADERLSVRRVRLTATAPDALARSAGRLDTVTDRLLIRVDQHLQRETDRLTVAHARLRAVDPAVQLARGWSITRIADGRVVRTTDDVAHGDVVTTTLVDGSLTSTIDTVTPRPPDESEST